MDDNLPILTPEQIEQLRQQGHDVRVGDEPSSAPDTVAAPSAMSTPSAIGATLKAHAGGTIGGGAGALGTMALVAPWLAGPEVGIPANIAMMLLGAGGAVAGGYAGQKVQKVLESDDTYNAQQQAAAQAVQEHPYVSAGTDIASSALASGGSFSPTTALRGLRGLVTGGADAVDRAALKNVALQSVVNPALNTGIQYATTGELPSETDLLQQSVGGALFAKPSFLGSLGHRTPVIEPTKEPTLSDTAEPSQPTQTSPWLEQNDNGYRISDSAVRNAWMEQHPKPKYNEIIDPVAKAQAMTEYNNAKNTSTDQVRELLHKQYIDKNPSTPTVEPLKSGSEDGVTTPSITPEKPIAQNQTVDSVKNTDDLAKVDADQQKQMNQPTLDTATGNVPEKSEVPSKEEQEALQKELEESGNVVNSAPKGWNEVTPTAQPYGEDHIATPSMLMGHLVSGNATTGSVLHSLSNTPNHPFQDMARELFASSDRVSLNTPISIDRSEEPRSAFVFDKKGPYSKIKMAMGNLNDSRVLMEEVVHSLTSTKLPDFGGSTGKELAGKYSTYLSDSKSNPAIKDLISAHLQTAKAFGHSNIFFGEEGLAGHPDTSLNEFQRNTSNSGKYGYAMGDLHEFLAHAFKDKGFQQKLNSIPSNVQGKTVWQKIVDAVRRLLGMDVKSGSMLEHVLSTGREIASQERPNLKETGKSEIKETNTAKKIEEDNIPKTNHMGWVGNVTRSMIDKIRDIAHPSAKTVADAFQNTLAERQKIIGQQLNPILQTSEKVHLSQADDKQLSRVAQYERINGKSGEHLLTSEAQRAVYKVAKRALEDNYKYRVATKEPVYRNGVPTTARRDEFYWPTTTNPKVAQTYRTNTDTKEISRLDNEFLAHQKANGIPLEEAKENLKAWKIGVQGSSKNAGTVGNQQFFNASRRAQGVSLPPEFTRPGFLKNIESYFHRQAMDNAHYKYIEANPKVLSALGETKDAWNRKVEADPNGGIAGNPAVQAQLKEFHGETGGAGFHNERALSALATSTFISSPALEFHKLMSNIVGVASYAENPYQLVRTLGNAVKNIRDGYQHAIDQGTTRLTAKSWGDMLNGNLAAADRLQAVAQSVRKISSLNDLTNKWGTGLIQAASESIIPSKILRANNGSVTAQQFMRRLDPQYKVGKSYSSQEQQALAAQLTGYIHGTADGRTMPAWMSGDSEVSGFFKLAHWSVAQTNRFMNDVYSPATRGDIAPLIHSIFGAAIGGYIIKEVREKLSGKKGPIPSLQEIAASDKGLEGNVPLLAYNAIAAAQYAGFGGLLSQIAKYPFDFVYKNKPQGATFPIDEVAGDLGETLKTVSETIANDPNVDWARLAQAVTSHVLTSNFQLGRMAYNQAINAGLIDGTPAEKKELGDKLNQLRRFDMVEGLPYNSIDEGNNPYMNLEQKAFKSTQDVGEAVKQLPQLIDNIITTYHDKPDVMEEKLKALKQNTYATMPSMETTPISFIKYIRYLNRTEGVDAAQKELKEYLTHKALNSAKASIIP